MSGHNKWSKIKRKKALGDAERGRLFSKHARLIAVESRLVGGDRAAAGLSAAIERAKKDLMPKENIERAIAKGAGGEAGALTEVVFEGYGPGGVAVLVVAVTDNNNRTSQEIRCLFANAGGTLGVPGAAMWAFKKTAAGYVPKHPATIATKEGAVLAELVEALLAHDDVKEVFTTADDASLPEG
jgi:YebC/PmpR family DNA-binding regulatory protein